MTPKSSLNINNPAAQEIREVVLTFICSKGLVYECVSFFSEPEFWNTKVG